MPQEKLVPTLPELQRSFARALSDSGTTALDLADWMHARLETYANTRHATLTQALALTFPAVRALVGAQFFEALAWAFAATTPPASAYLNDYGAELSRFLRRYKPAASIVYLPDVAQLEWAVSRACHAPDAPRWNPQELCALDPGDLACVSFIAHPSVATLRLAYPADHIWRAVLEQDEAGMRAIDLAAGPVHVLVERDPEEQVQVCRLLPAAWQFTRRLLAGQPLFQALSPAAESAQATLAEHLSAGRFIGCRHDSNRGDPSP
jgi:hypothetical protein